MILPFIDTKNSALLEILMIILSPSIHHMYYIFPNEKFIGVMSGDRGGIETEPLVAKILSSKCILIGYQLSEQIGRIIFLLKVNI